MGKGRRESSFTDCLDDFIRYREKINEHYENQKTETTNDNQDITMAAQTAKYGLNSSGKIRTNSGSFMIGQSSK